MTLKHLLEEHGIEVEDGTLALFEEYLVFLKTAPVNLTSFSESELPVKVILDTLFPLKDFPIHTKFIDIGTGGGIPGIVLAAYFQSEGVLVDSTKKKVEVLRKFAEEKSMDVTLIWSRAEKLAREKEHRGAYEFVVTRALARTTIALELTAPFSMVGGYVLLYKGKNWNEELDEAWRTMEILGLDLGDVIEYTLPTGEKRALMIFEKIKTTPRKFPRKFSQIKKHPLR